MDKILLCSKSHENGSSMLVIILSAFVSCHVALELALFEATCVDPPYSSNASPSYVV